MKNEELYNDLIIRYLDGTVTTEEAGELLSWLKLDKQNMQLFVEIKDLWEKTGLLNNNDTETELALRTFKYRLKNKTELGGNRKLTLFSRIAAILIIALLSGILLVTLLNKPESNEQLVYSETVIPIGQKGQVLLSDGTKIWLNSGSRIKYPSGFNRSTRDVYLEGEAYFEVAHDTTKPFLVHSGALTVKVLGTSFNLKSYPQEDRIETTLISGSVKILETKDKESIEIITLKPNEQAIYNISDRKVLVKKLVKEEQLAKSTNSPPKTRANESLLPHVESVIQWKDQKLIFEDETLEQMAEKLTRWYGKKIYIESEALKSNKYSGKFIYNETIYQVLEIISLTTNISYYEKDHNIYIKIKE